MIRGGNDSSVLGRDSRSVEGPGIGPTHVMKEMMIMHILEFMQICVIVGNNNYEPLRRCK
jgi:hypothetical protein